MRGRPPKRKNERFKAPTYSNGDTKLELLTRTKRALTQSREKWSDKTAERMKILFQEEPKLKEAYDIVNGLRSIFRSKTLDKEAAKVKLHDWYETATRCSLREIKSARDAIKSREDEVLNYLRILTILTPIPMMLTPSKRAWLSKSSPCLLANRQ